MIDQCIMCSERGNPKLCLSVRSRRFGIWLFQHLGKEVCGAVNKSVILSHLKKTFFLLLIIRVLDDYILRHTFIIMHECALQPCACASIHQNIFYSMHQFLFLCLSRLSRLSVFFFLSSFCHSVTLSVSLLQSLFFLSLYLALSKFYLSISLSLYLSFYLSVNLYLNIYDTHLKQPKAAFISLTIHIAYCTSYYCVCTLYIHIRIYICIYIYIELYLECK